MKTLRFLVMLFVLLPFWAVSQEATDLYENFNKEVMETFPPYGWTQIDADGDGALWTTGPDGVDYTVAAESYIWMFNTYMPDNWLITPKLSVDAETDSLKYWVGSFMGQSNYMEVWVSTSGSALEDFTYRIDSVTFDVTVDHYDRSVSLSQFQGQQIFIAFRHLYKAELPGIENTISIILDNVSGPKVVPFETEVGVSEIIYFDGIVEPCDISDQPVTVVVSNNAKTAISDFSLSCQSYGITEDSTEYFSDIVTETVNRTLQPGDTLHYTFRQSLPFSKYANDKSRQVLLRAFIGQVEGDEYPRNDTLMLAFYKQNSFEMPLKAGFESYYPDEDPGFVNWYTGMYPSSYSLPPFSIGENPAMAHAGMQYLSAGVYPPDGFTAEQTPQTGENVYVATRCLALESGKDYRIDMFYGFRVLPSDWERQGINFRVVVGKDPYNLLVQPHEVVLDTFLPRTQDLIMPENAIYTLLSSKPFQIKETGVYYMGLVFYSDDPVEEQTDTWVVFVDDFALRYASDPIPADLLLESVSVPSDCNLTDAEEISAVFRNVSGQTLSGIEISYSVDGNEPVKETLGEELAPGAQKTYYFETKADFSEYGKHGITVSVSHPSDVDFLENNTKTVVSVNSEVVGLPYVDDFEEYATTKVFEDEWRVYMQGYYTWMAAQDFTEDTSVAYNGVGFLADASFEEYYVAPDDWAVSRCFEFEKGKSYEISFMYRIEKESPNRAALYGYILSSYDTASKVEKVVDLFEIKNVEYRKYSYAFTSERDMVAHLGLHSNGVLGAPAIMMDALRIEEVPETSGEPRAESFFSLYPNPVRDELNVISSKPMNRVEVYDMTGKKTVSESVDGCSFRLNVETYGEGLYLMMVENAEGERSVRKFVVTR